MGKRCVQVAHMHTLYRRQRKFVTVVPAVATIITDFVVKTIRQPKKGVKIAEELMLITNVPTCQDCSNINYTKVIQSFVC